MIETSFNEDGPRPKPRRIGYPYFFLPGEAAAASRRNAGYAQTAAVALLATALAAICWPLYPSPERFFHPIKLIAHAYQSALTASAWRRLLIRSAWLAVGTFVTTAIFGLFHPPEEKLKLPDERERI